MVKCEFRRNDIGAEAGRALAKALWHNQMMRTTAMCELLLAVVASEGLQASPAAKLLLLCGYKAADTGDYTETCDAETCDAETCDAETCDAETCDAETCNTCEYTARVALCATELADHLGKEKATATCTLPNRKSNKHRRRRKKKKNDKRKGREEVALNLWKFVLEHRKALWRRDGYAACVLKALDGVHRVYCGRCVKQGGECGDHAAAAAAYHDLCEVARMVQSVPPADDAALRETSHYLVATLMPHAHFREHVRTGGGTVAGPAAAMGSDLYLRPTIQALNWAYALYRRTYEQLTPAEPMCAYVHERTVGCWIGGLIRVVNDRPSVADEDNPDGRRQNLCCHMANALIRTYQVRSLGYGPADREGMVALEEAVVRGSVQAMCMLAVHHGSERDYAAMADALRWMTTNTRVPGACAALGQLFARGLGVRKDKEEAARLVARARRAQGRWEPWVRTGALDDLTVHGCLAGEIRLNLVAEDDGTPPRNPRGGGGGGDDPIHSFLQRQDQARAKALRREERRRQEAAAAAAAAAATGLRASANAHSAADAVVRSERLKQLVRRRAAEEREALQAKLSAAMLAETAAKVTADEKKRAAREARERRRTQQAEKKAAQEKEKMAQQQERVRQARQSEFAEIMAQQEAERVAERVAEREAEELARMQQRASEAWAALDERRRSPPPPPPPPPRWPRRPRPPRREGTGEAASSKRASRGRRASKPVGRRTGARSNESS
jgi:hypothetical protein